MLQAKNNWKILASTPDADFWQAPTASAACGLSSASEIACKSVAAAIRADLSGLACEKRFRAVLGGMQISIHYRRKYNRLQSLDRTCTWVWVCRVFFFARTLWKWVKKRPNMVRCLAVNLFRKRTLLGYEILIYFSSSSFSLLRFHVWKEKSYLLPEKLYIEG